VFEAVLAVTLARHWPMSLADAQQSEKHCMTMTNWQCVFLKKFRKSVIPVSSYDTLPIMTAAWQVVNSSRHLDCWNDGCQDL